MQENAISTLDSNLMQFKYYKNNISTDLISSNTIETIKNKYNETNKRKSKQNHNTTKKYMHLTYKHIHIQIYSYP